MQGLQLQSIVLMLSAGSGVILALTPSDGMMTVDFMHTFCSLAAACLAASLLPPADITFPAFCFGAGAAPLLDGGRPGAAAPLLLFDPEAAHAQSSGSDPAACVLIAMQLV